MSLTVDDLIAPTGDITPAMFPEDTTGAFRTRLSGYLDRAEAEVATTGITEAVKLDRAVKAWTEYLVFNAVADRLAAIPAGASLQNTGSQSISGHQYKYFHDRALAALAEYQLLITVDTNPIVPRNARSGAVPTKFGW